MKSHKQVKNELSRRDFIKATAVGATALAGLGSKEAAAAQLPGKWHYEADVVVVGFGGAGGAAAWEALKAGASTTILERMDSAGGSTNICGGQVYMGGGTPLQKSFGITNDSRDNMYNYYLAAAREGADPHLVGVFCDKSLALYDWLTNAIGVKWGAAYQDEWPAKPVSGTMGLCWSGEEQTAEFAAVAKPAPRCHVVAAQNGSGLFEPLKAAVLKLGARVLYQAQGKKLIVNPQTGHVAGVIASYQGRDTYVKAKKAVVLTTGGFAFNQEMVATHAPAFKGVSPVGTASDDGSGIKMGQEIGADVSRMQYATVTPRMGIYAAYSNWGSVAGVLNGIPCQLRQGILVDKNGQRYMPEDHGEGLWETAVQSISPLASIHTSYLIIDSRIYNQIGGFPASLSSFITAKANTIEDLAIALKTAPGVLEDTVRFYNQQAEHGEDPLFNKLKKYVVVLTTPPFYAVSRPPGFLLTNCGLRINTKAQVLNTTAKPIPGLYAAGRVSSGVLSQNYPGSGSSVADCLTFGRIAGQDAVAWTPLP